MDLNKLVIKDIIFEEVLLGEHPVEIMNKLPLTYGYKKSKIVESWNGMVEESNSDE